MPRIFHEGNLEINELRRGHLYSYRIRFPADDAHPKRYWSKTYKVKANSKAEAIAVAIEMEHELSGGKPEPARILISRYARQWHVKRGGADLDGTVKFATPSVDPRTLKRDSSLIRRIEVYFPDDLVVDLTDKKILERYRQFRADGASEHMVFQLHAKLRQILDACVEDEIINRNPAKRIRMKRPKPTEESLASKRVEQDASEKLVKYLMNTDKSGEDAIVLLALFTAMRRGEILALSWSNIDLDGKSVSVRAQYTDDSRMKTPKADSFRVIALDDVVVEWLSDWKEKQKTLFEDHHFKWSESTPVCTASTFRRVSPKVFDRYRRKLFVHLGIGRFEYRDVREPSGRMQKYEKYIGPGLHSLRKAHATMLVLAGVDPKTVQHRLGHASIATTLQIYAEAVEQADRNAAATISAMLLGADGQ